MQLPSCRTHHATHTTQRRNVGMACDAVKKPKYATHATDSILACVGFSCACIACVAVFMLLWDMPVGNPVFFFSYACPEP